MSTEQTSPETKDAAPSPSTPVKSSHNIPCSILSGGCVITVILIVGFFIYVGVVGINGLGNVTDFFRSIFNGFNQPTQASVTNSQTIVTQIQPLGQLVSISVQVAKADIFVGIEQSTANMCGFSANHVAQGTVEAGIDLMTLSEEDTAFDPTTNTYTINLPPPQLTSCRIDYIRQYDRSTTLCAVDWDEARLLANYSALISFRDDAQEGGILDSAEQQAQVVLTSFIEGLTGANVVINFTENAPSVIPPSCQPDAPQGWTYNEASNSWTRGN